MSLPVPSSVVGVGDNFDHYQHVITKRFKALLEQESNRITFVKFLYVSLCRSRYIGTIEPMCMNCFVAGC